MAVRESDQGKSIQQSKNKHLAKRNALSPTISAFTKAIERRAEAAKELVRSAAEVLCAVEEIKEQVSGKARYVVDMADWMVDAIEEGKCKLDTDRNGRLYAQIRESNGSFGDKIPIKKELASGGLDPLAIQNAIQMQAIQQQLTVVIDALSSIDETVGEIKQGQHNDRMGVLLGGQALYMESCDVSDSTMQKLLKSQALKSLSDSNAQLMQSAQADIAYLVNGGYKSRKKEQTAVIRERITSLRSTIEAVNAAFALKMLLYYELNEIKALQNVLDQYAGFISEAIAPHAGILAELDESDVLPRGGFWSEKANCLNGILTLKRAMESSDESIGLLENGSEDEECENGKG